jgi:two-component system, OmpR family, phosphate regulon sensor histidine kinase PhoR
MVFPRGLLIAFVALVLLPAATLVALGVQLLQQDRALEHRRRLENSAAAIHRFQLESLRDAQLGPFLFLSNPPLLPEPPPDPTADRLEFQSPTPSAAIAHNSRLATHANSAIRAGALLRLARIHRKQKHLPLALEAWSRLTQIPGVAIDAEPAPLFARRAICRALAAARSSALSHQARQLLADLYSGRYPLSRQAFLIASQQAQDWLGVPSPPPPASLARAEALAALWPRRSSSSGMLCHANYLLLWSETNSTLTSLPSFAACSPAGLPVPLPTSAPLPEFTARRNALLAALLTLFVLISTAAAFAFRAVTRELSAARLQSDFVAAVSHEFRTPLTSLRQFNEMLIDSPGLPAQTRVNYYQAQSRATARLSRLVETLLDFGRMEAGRRPYDLQPIDAAQFVRLLASDFQSEPVARNFRIHCCTPSSPLPVRADRDALWRAIWNLLDNAVKYSAQSRDIELSARAHGRDILISVTDSGLGIPPRDLPRLFQKFVRAQNAMLAGIPGTGIGLAMVRQIAEAHGGAIAAVSNENKGSTFTLTLPHA